MKTKPKTKVNTLQDNVIQGKGKDSNKKLVDEVNKGKIKSAVITDLTALKNLKVNG